ncbi:Cytochrome monooxygenase xanG [Penicillium atrosanguineum]|uniref:Cytochrome monooxygenase xanG n=1 Tax=Penicillium atrosanguineum TaxID=1132637 RepID=A0A9W9PTG0_9EURO|nr:Cytochrome monooxygenase xanG [Penicillium atrosanguineum]KAJ5311014.1 Cytochrome monooxygenase xanG [Penicillium atrosanguineum]
MIDITAQFDTEQKVPKSFITPQYRPVTIINTIAMIDWTTIFTWGQGIPTLLLTALLVLYWYIRIPSDMPKNIPTIPIYISLLGLWSDMGQDDIFDRWLRIPLEKHGAVRIWFAGRWNILATRPQFLVDMFRHEDVYAKAGSQKKIPWSVIAALVGDNIINAHGQNWKLYTSIMKSGLQRRITDSGPLLEKSRLFVDILLEEQEKPGEKGVVVNPIIQRWALSCMGISFMNVDLEALERPGQRLEELQTIIKKTLFKPLFFNFPDLDKYPTIFPKRRAAFAIMQEFGDLLVSTVQHRIHTTSTDGDQVVDLLDRALKENKITLEQYRANLKVTFLTAHENAQQLLNSTIYVLGTNKTIQSTLRTEVLCTNTTSPSPDLLNSLPYLTSTILELLRLYPPVSQLINRVTTSPSTLGGVIPIPSHTWVGWNAYGVHTDTTIWGPDARDFKPERWGMDVKSIQATVRSKTTACHFIAFNAHSRKCLGQGFAMLQMKVLMFELVWRAEWDVHPGYELKLTSGGIMAPLGLRVIFREPRTLTVEADLLFADALDRITEHDIPVIPGAAAPIVEKLVENEALEIELIQTYANLNPTRPPILFSVCMGAFLLAAAKRLSGLTVTTHRYALDNLEDLCSRVHGDQQPTHIVYRRFVDGGYLDGTRVQMITSGGISSGLDDTFYLVCRLLNAEIAAHIS